MARISTHHTEYPHYLSSMLGIDVIALVDSLDLLYEDIAKNGRDGLEFSQALDLVLNMRGGNPAPLRLQFKNKFRSRQRGPGALLMEEA